MIPDWAPNIHPLIVHFPIALLFIAVLLDLVSFALRRIKGFQTAAVLLYVVGIIGLVAAYITGNEAAETVNVPTDAMATFTDHQDWALWTLIFFVVFGVVRLAALWFYRERPTVVTVPLAIIGLVGLFFLWQTADHGARMVFQYGVGVERVQMLAEKLAAYEREAIAARASPSFADDGSWDWRIGEGAEIALQESFDWPVGSPDDVEIEVVDTNQGPALAITGRERPVMFAAGDPLSSVQIVATLNADDFEGSITLVHNITDASNYHFVRYENGAAVQGRIVDGEEETLDDGIYETDGWVTFRASGDEGHFYGYAGDRMVAHGHVTAPEAGSTGIMLDGTGTVLIERLQVTRLR